MTDTVSSDTVPPAPAASDAQVEVGGVAPDAEGPDVLVREGDIAADYLERLLDIVDYDGDIDLDVENGRAMVAIVGSDLQALIGQNRAALDDMEEMTETAL